MATVRPFSLPIDRYGWTLTLRSVAIAVEACLFMCAECFIGCIESAIEYFNRCVRLPPSASTSIPDRSRPQLCIHRDR